MHACRPSMRARSTPRCLGAFLRAAGRVGPRRLVFTELDCIAANGLSYATCVFDFLTFGCDGASAAAPIANANTAFMVAQFGSVAPA